MLYCVTRLFSYYHMLILLVSFSLANIALTMEMIPRNLHLSVLQQFLLPSNDCVTYLAEAFCWIGSNQMRALYCHYCYRYFFGLLFPNRIHGLLDLLRIVVSAMFLWTTRYQATSTMWISFWNLLCSRSNCSYAKRRPSSEQTRH